MSHPRVHHTKSTDFFAPMAEEEIVNEPSLTKRKSTNVLAPMAGEDIVHGSQPDDRLICADGQVTNIFFNQYNLSKQCAQGAIANLLNMLKCSTEELDLFWNLANSDDKVIEKQLCKHVPKNYKSRTIESKSVYGYPGNNSSLLQQGSST